MELKEDGTIICPKCNGKGFIEILPDTVTLFCRKCKGTGVLDWVEMIVGKKIQVLDLKFTTTYPDTFYDSSVRPITNLKRMEVWGQKTMGKK